MKLTKETKIHIKRIEEIEKTLDLLIEDNYRFEKELKKVGKKKYESKRMGKTKNI